MQAFDHTQNDKKIQNLSLVIIAAGKGSRLSADIPKALYTLANTTLLERHIHSFSKLGVKHFVLVTGAYHQLLEAAVSDLERLYRVKIDALHNSEYQRANGVSVAKAVEFLLLNKKKTCLLTMSDHVYSDNFLIQFLTKLKFDFKGLQLAVDQPGLHNRYIDVEDVTCVSANEDGVIVEIGKKIGTYQYYDTGLFFLADSFFSLILDSVAHQVDSLSESVQRLANQKLAIIVEVTNEKWMDIDTKSDVQNFYQYWEEV